MHNFARREDIKNITSKILPWQKLEGKTILITGANGFIASYIVDTFLFLNENQFINKMTILALVRNKEKALKRFSTDRKDLIFIVQDVSDPIKIDRDIHYIIHAASQASPKYYGIDPVGTIAPNIIGTYNLLKLAREKKIETFLFFSSGEIYGKTKSPIKEEDYGKIDPLQVRSCYAEGKRAGETLCISWMHQYKVPVKIIRLFHTYGLGMDLEDGRVFADFINCLVQNKNIKLNSDGSAIRAFMYISDAIIGILTVFFKGNNGEAYNIGNDEAIITIKDLAKELISLFPEKKLEVEFNKNIKKGYLKSTLSIVYPDVSKIRSLGWMPTIGIREGFEKVVRNYDKIN